eukprot:scaffold415_cov362-Prasinococcus_capsulatus_cf.AAC.3
MAQLASIWSKGSPAKQRSHIARSEFACDVCGPLRRRQRESTGQAVALVSACAHHLGVKVAGPVLVDHHATGAEVAHAHHLLHGVLGLGVAILVGNHDRRALRAEPVRCKRLRSSRPGVRAPGALTVVRQVRPQKRMAPTAVWEGLSSLKYSLVMGFVRPMLVRP